MPKISEVLSQHGLLTSICECISGADIANLAVTCTEHRMYITSSQPIHEKLMSSTICSGKGLEAQEKIFGPRDSLLVTDEAGNDHEIKNPRKKRCLGANSRLCSECGVNVCDNCRFHFVYPFEGVAGRDRAWHAKFERGVIDGLEEEYSEDDDHRGIKKLECRKALDTFWAKRLQFYCASCEPPFLPGLVCTCDIYEHFVGSRWLCVPCFFEEEAAVQHVKNTEVRRYDRSLNHYFRGPVCGCGAPALVDTLETCRMCNRSVWAHGGDHADRLFERLLYELGHQPGREGILAQLG